MEENSTSIASKLYSQFTNSGVDIEKYVEFRKDIHKHPEGGFKEFRTRDKVVEQLLSLGIIEEQITHLAETGLFVDIQGTAEESKEGDCETLAFRTELDALLMTEESGLEETSVTDYAHMCGHDGHIATLLVAADFWMNNRDQIPKNKKIRLLFQPAEEGPGGAEPMIKEGCLEGIDEIYGYHNAPVSAEGTISVKGGAFMAGISELDIEIEGKGGHGSEPAYSIDPITAAWNIHSSLHTLKSRSIKNKDMWAFTIWAMSSGSTYNVIPRTATMKGTIRYFDEEVKDTIVSKIDSIVESTSEALGCKGKVTWSHMYPPVINHDKHANIVAEIAKANLGNTNWNESENLPAMASEDFSYYLQKVPGAFFFAGSVKPNTTLSYPHSSTYTFNDNLIPVAAYMFIKISEHRLGICFEQFLNKTE